MNQEQTQTLDLALEALEKIAQHEKECGERWGEATAELRQLMKSVWLGLLMAVRATFYKSGSVWLGLLLLLW
jgi:hypothetical protein